MLRVTGILLPRGLLKRVYGGEREIEIVSERMEERSRSKFHLSFGRRALVTPYSFIHQDVLFDESKISLKL